MRKILSGLLLLGAIPIVFGSGAVLSGKFGAPSLFSSVALGLLGQATVLMAGFVASPKEGKTGPVRAIAFTFFLVQSIAGAVLFVSFIYERLMHVEFLESRAIACGFTLSSSALVLVLVTASAWRLSKGRSIMK
jgi:hypothetical protein